MAAAMVPVLRAWFIDNIQVIGRLRQARCSSMFSASLASYFGGFSKDKDCYGGRYMSSLSLVTRCRGTSSKSGTHLHQKNYQLQSCKNIQIICSRWITTSAFYLNRKYPMSNGKYPMSNGKYPMSNRKYPMSNGKYPMSNGKYPMSNGKRKMKKRIEKVKEMRESILTVPNLLSAFRIVAAPFLGYFIISEEFTVAAVLFGVAGITDMLDGYIARNFKNQKSVFGTILDPVADKILMSVLTISLTVAELLPIPLTVLILSRDVLLVAAASYFRYKSLPSPKTISRYFDVNLATVELRPNLLGKTNTVLQLGLVGSTLLAPIVGYVDHPYLQALWFVVGTSTVLSSFSYLFSTSTSVRYLK